MTVAYLDANAVIDRFSDPTTSPTADAAARLAEGGAGFITSALTSVEVHRFLHRVVATDAAADARAMLTGTTTVPLGGAVLAVAGSIGVQHLGALDAIHLATALLVRADVVVTRDRQLARAAQAVGIPVL